MRSDLVFSANNKIQNRFLLCRVTSLSVKKLHVTATSFPETINTVFVKVGTAAPDHGWISADAAQRAIEELALPADALLLPL